MSLLGLQRRRYWIFAALVAVAAGCETCNAIPANRLPPELQAVPRATDEPINFIQLRQNPPPVYQLGPRDILGIFIEGVLGKSDEPPPTHFPENGNTPPAIGFPMPIREDGTVALPLIPPLQASGLTLAQLERQIRKAYTVDQQILQPGRDRIIVTLIKKRTYQIMVIREDAGSGSTPVLDTGMAGGTAGRFSLGPTKRGSADAVDLDAYENDVLHALAETGGMPGFDAKNEVIILRGGFSDPQSRDWMYNQLSEAGPGYGLNPLDPNITVIPLRFGPNQPPVRVREEEIILTTGDIVFVEGREREVFYTGGMLIGGEHMLPRDFDLDVVQAVSVSGGFSSSAGGVSPQARGIGGGGGGGGGIGMLCPPTQVIVIRTMPGGGQVPIKVDMKRAVVDSSQRILIQPGDMILLEYTPCELAFNIVLNNLSFNYFLNGLNNN